MFGNISKDQISFLFYCSLKMPRDKSQISNKSPSRRLKHRKSSGKLSEKGSNPDINKVGCFFWFSFIRTCQMHNFLDNCLLEKLQKYGEIQ